MGDDRDIFGNELVAAKPTRTAQALEATAALKRVEARYVDAFKRAWSIEPILNFGRDRKQLKTLLTQLSEAEVLALMDTYFADRGRRGNYTVPEFVLAVPALRLEGQRQGSKDVRTVANVDAVRRGLKR